MREVRLPVLRLARPATLSTVFRHAPLVAFSHGVIADRRQSSRKTTGPIDLVTAAG